MSTAAEQRSAKIEDVARLRDEGHAVELVDGEIVHKAQPTPAHGAAQRKIGAVLDAFDGRGGPRGSSGSWLMTEVEVHSPRPMRYFGMTCSGFAAICSLIVPTKCPSGCVRIGWAKCCRRARRASMW